MNDMHINDTLPLDGKSPQRIVAGAIY